MSKQNISLTFSISKPFSIETTLYKSKYRVLCYLQNTGSKMYLTLLRKYYGSNHDMWHEDMADFLVEKLPTLKEKYPECLQKSIWEQKRYAYKRAFIYNIFVNFVIDKYKHWLKQQNVEPLEIINEDGDLMERNDLPSTETDDELRYQRLMAAMQTLSGDDAYIALQILTGTPHKNKLVPLPSGIVSYQTYCRRVIALQTRLKELTGNL